MVEREKGCCFTGIRDARNVGTYTNMLWCKCRSRFIKKYNNNNNNHIIVIIITMIRFFVFY